MDKKYWIIVDGKPQGPFTADQLRLRRDFTAELPVWTTGMSDWTTVAAVPELAELVSSEPEISEPEQSSGAETTAAETFGAPSLRLNTSRGWVAAEAVASGEKMPNSYLGWNIVMTLCCCLPVGVAGIFFSSMVSQKWQRGDIEGAKKASERAAWCLILSFVLGLVGWPFQMLFQMNSLGGM